MLDPSQRFTRKGWYLIPGPLTPREEKGDGHVYFHRIFLTNVRRPDGLPPLVENRGTINVPVPFSHLRERSAGR
jgi:hypothetical protein